MLCTAIKLALKQAKTRNLVSTCVFSIQGIVPMSFDSPHLGR